MSSQRLGIEKFTAKRVGKKEGVVKIVSWMLVLVVMAFACNQDEILKLNHQIASLTTENQQLKAKIADLNKSREDLAMENRQLKAKIADLEKGRTDLSGQATGNSAVDEAKADVQGKRAKFPDLVAAFIRLNEIKQEAFAKSYPGTVMSGRGQIREVGKCGFTDDSKKWGEECYKITIDKGTPRIVLYFGDKDKARIADLNNGSMYSFSDCVGVSIKNWGFWSTATCDMP